jgi:hypothetical protein
MSPNQRRGHFKRAANRAGLVWRPDHVITLHCYDHSFCFENFKMTISPTPITIDMVGAPGSQLRCIIHQAPRKLHHIPPCPHTQPPTHPSILTNQRTNPP